jgi:hypothetical protein
VLIKQTKKIIKPEIKSSLMDQEKSKDEKKLKYGNRDDKNVK